MSMPRSAIEPRQRADRRAIQRMRARGSRRSRRRAPSRARRWRKRRLSRRAGSRPSLASARGRPGAAPSRIVFSGPPPVPRTIRNSSTWTGADALTTARRLPGAMGGAERRATARAPRHTPARRPAPAPTARPGRKCRRRTRSWPAPRRRDADRGRRTRTPRSPSRRGSQARALQARAQRVRTSARAAAR